MFPGDDRVLALPQVRRHTHAERRVLCQEILIGRLSKDVAQVAETTASGLCGRRLFLTTTTTLIAVPTNLTVGQTLTLTATVTASGGATPAGTVTFNDGATALGTATLNNSGVVALAIRPR